jgi:hypothetical protein
VCDNEHTSATLGDSKPLSVQNSVGEPIPEFCQRPEEGAKVPSSCRRQDSRDVLPDNPTGTKDANKLYEPEGQVATWVSQATSEASNAEGLAGGSSDKKVNWASLIQHFLREFCHVAQVLEFPVMVNHCGREWLNL